MPSEPMKAERERALEVAREILLDRHCMVGSNPDAPLEKICYCGWRGIGLLQHSQHAADERMKEGADLLLAFAAEREREAVIRCAIEACERDSYGESSGTMLGDMWARRIAELQPTRGGKP